MLHITHVEHGSISAVFDFHHDTSGANGEFRMSGTYDPAQARVRFTPGAWIRPYENYSTVGMEGQISGRGGILVGRITNPYCSSFYLTRSSSASGSATSPNRMGF